jgi:hypothetical protein
MLNKIINLTSTDWALYVVGESGSSEGGEPEGGEQDPADGSTVGFL